jgi:hypothetical protein
VSGRIALGLFAATLLGTACGEVESPAQDAGSEADASTPDPDASGALPTLYIGRPSPLVGVHLNGGSHRSPRFARDDLALYFAADAPSGPIHLATRSSTSARFDRPVPVAGADFQAYSISSFALSADELEIFVAALPAAGPEGTFDLYRAERSARDGMFEELALVAELSMTGTDDDEPFLSADGLEIVFASSRLGSPAIFSARRAEPGGVFEAPVPIDLGSSAGDRGPTLSPDGRRLFFGRVVGTGEVAPFVAVRATTRGLDYGEPVERGELSIFGTSTDQVALGSTGEVVFRSNRAWSPAVESIWIAQACEGAPCDDPEVTCPEGVRSVDRRHCYWFEPPEEATDWDTMRARCAAAGATLITVNSAAEDELTVILAGSGGNTIDVWVGGTDRDGECNVSVPGCSFAWVTGEPFIYNRWAAGEPNDGDLVAIEDCMTYRPVPAAYNDDGCEKPFPAVCERELFPPW